MSANRHIQERIHRLETLRRYQAYYGPNTPYQIVAEINQLEGELRRMLQADLTRPTQTINPAVHRPPKPKKTTSTPKPETKQFLFWHMSQATVDLIATIAFIGLVFLLGSIVFAAYIQSSSANDDGQSPIAMQAPPTLRPTFTPTADPNNPSAQPVAEAVEAVAIENSLLPAAVKPATEVPTAVPTLTPSALPTSTNTPTPTSTPIPTQPPPIPPPPSTATPGPPTPTPAPSFPFTIAETGNRVFQKTNNHAITIYVAITTLDNVPIGGLKVVGDHVPTGIHTESGLSDWSWSATNCLDCDYAKFGNLKFEPGPFSDGVWNIYVADGQGTPLSPTASFSYASDPEQWVWDFIIFRKNSF